MKHNEDKIINKILPKKTLHIAPSILFLTGAGPEFPNHVIDNVITIAYHYFHVKNKHFGYY